MGKIQRILILGAGGHGQVVANVLLSAVEAGAPIEPLGYLDDNPELLGREVLGLPVIGTFGEIDALPHDAIVLGIGDNASRKRLYCELSARGETFAAAVHPRAVISHGASLGPGAVVCALAVVGTAVTIGFNTVLNASCLVGHHSVVADHAHVGPGANIGGEVRVGKGSLVGMGATVLSRVDVGAWSTVGAGALAGHNVPDSITVIGNPARPMAAAP
jgi:sugar O-acyltransferase (sialic acid O-acetyltransferase NeuD family)